MLFINQLKVSIKSIIKGKTLKLGILLSLAGLVIAEPWRRETLPDALCSGFSWFSLMLGLLTGFMALCWSCSRYYRNVNRIVRINNRTDYAVHLFLSVAGTAYAAAFFYTALVFLTAIRSKGESASWGWISNCIPDPEIRDLSGIFFRTFAVLGLLLVICGLCFYIILFWTGRVAPAVFLPLLIPAIDEMNQSLWGGQLVMNYVFPPETFFYFDNTQFSIGCVGLLAVVLGLFAALAVILYRLDFI